jgi:two-component system response regulator HydG
MNDHAAPPRATLSGHHSLDRLIGQSAPMRRLKDLIGKVGQITAPVVLLGETGTGKELVARAIHFTGSHREMPFVPVECSAVAPTLFESELFGHAKGAFTGADHPRRGLLQSASDGTIFLDEIGELPIYLQAKLLRALQEKEIRPVGSTERIRINVRVIAATNRDLEAGVREGTFRQDLYFRLNVVQIKLPALRERKGDIPLLVAHFLHKLLDPLQPARSISDDALRRLMAYDWPGNVRELENAIECALALSSDTVLTVDDLDSVPNCASALALPTNMVDDLSSVPNGMSALGPFDSDESVPLWETERRAIVSALQETGGDKIAAAHLLGIGKTTIYRKIKKYAWSLSAVRQNFGQLRGG